MISTYESQEELLENATLVAAFMVDDEGQMVLRVDDAALANLRKPGRLRDQIREQFRALFAEFETEAFR